MTLEDVRKLVRVVDGHARFVVRAKPRSKREGVELAAAPAPCVVVRVRAPPVEGAANAAIVAVLADVLQVRKGDVSIVRGETSREKDVEVRGLALDDVVTRLAAAIAATLH